ncbi:MAG TPA: electron transport complex subunit E [Bacillota bacterium]|nr:electron transport complex subunit E [Bacillota bacterium]
MLIQLLGMCPTLATTTSVSNAIGMGLAATVVLTCSNILISLLRKFIPKQVRIAVFIVIISGFVTAVELLMKAYFYELYGALGIFLPLIVVNCIILARAEAFASKNPVLPSAIDGLSCGIGFTLALIVVASIRELLGNGTFLGFQVFGENYPAAVVFILPAGAFLTLGCVIAAVQTLKNKADAKKSEKEAVAEAVANAAQAAAKEVQE